MLRVVLSMVLSLACLICSPTWADIPKPASIEDTVAAMADAYRASDKISDVQVNNEDSSVRVTFNDGTELTSYATNLHVKLINAESDQQRQELFDFHIAGIFEVNLSEEQAWTNESLARVFPVLRHRDFKTFSDKTGGSPLVTSGIIGDSDILYVLDAASSAAYITEDDLTDMALSTDELSQLALRNLEGKAAVVEFEGDGIWILLLDGFYESSLVLHSQTWNSIETQIGNVIMIVPNRDLVLFSEHTPETEKLMREFVAEYSSEGSYPLSKLVYLWREEQWQVLP